MAKSPFPSPRPRYQCGSCHFIFFFLSLLTSSRRDRLENELGESGRATGRLPCPGSATHSPPASLRGTPPGHGGARRLPSAPRPGSPSRGRYGRPGAPLPREGGKSEGSFSRPAGQVYRQPERGEGGETEPHPASPGRKGCSPHPLPQPSRGRGSGQDLGELRRASSLPSPPPTSPRSRSLQTRRSLRGPRPSTSRSPSAAGPSLQGLWGSLRVPRRPPPPPFRMARAPPAGTCLPGECGGRPRPLPGLAPGDWCCCCPGLSGGDSLFLLRVGTTISA